MYHEWGDEWDQKYGAELIKAMYYFQEFNRKYGRWYFGVKEKYGTMRLEYFWTRTAIDNLCGKNLIFIKHKLFHRFSQKFNVFQEFVGINKLIFKWQRYIFNLATIKTVEKFPNVKREFMDELEFRDLLYEKTKKKVGYICHWKTYKSGETVDD